MKLQGLWMISRLMVYLFYGFCLGSAITDSYNIQPVIPLLIDCSVESAFLSAHKHRSLQLPCLPFSPNIKSLSIM